MKNNDLEAIIISKPENQFYISGYTGEGQIIITQIDGAILTDFRYIEQAEKEASDYKIIEYKSGVSPYELIYNMLQSSGIKKVACESHYITVKIYEQIMQSLKDIEIVKTDSLIEELRTVKDEQEIEMIEKAQEITDKTFEHILNFIKPGVTELDLASEMEYFMKKNGAQGIAFDTIVVSGPRTSLPHGKPSDRQVQNGDLITLDFGARYNCYCADMTRTVLLGRPQSEHFNIYNIVLDAQKLALEIIKPGILCKDVDKVARDYMAGCGLDEEFGHGLGHGVGIEVHEEPKVSSKGVKKLLPGMVITIEPGIYIPGFGGVRIEDLIVITEEGYKNLTKSPKKFICI